MTVMPDDPFGGAFTAAELRMLRDALREATRRGKVTDAAGALDLEEARIVLALYVLADVFGWEQVEARVLELGAST